MWRLFAWRLGLEFWNFCAWALQYALPSWRDRIDRPVDYFAFGANLDPKVLANRGMRIRQETEVLLRDHALFFNQPDPLKALALRRSRRRRGGLLTAKF